MLTRRYKSLKYFNIIFKTEKKRNLLFSKIWAESDPTKIYMLVKNFNYYNFKYQNLYLKNRHDHAPMATNT